MCVHAEALDYYHKGNGKKVPSYLVILSRFNARCRSIRFRHQPKRSWFARKFGLEEGLEFHYIDIELSRGDKREKRAVPLRIFNIHLENAAGPKWRMARFNEVLRSLSKKRKNIICGDLNVFRAWYSWSWRLLLFLLGYPCSWGELWFREHEFFQRIFEKNNFADIFSGAATHEWSGNQLDYILVPNDFEISSHTLFSETYGSDHRPMLVEIEI